MVDNIKPKTTRLPSSTELPICNKFVKYIYTHQNLSFVGNLTKNYIGTEGKPCTIRNSFLKIKFYSLEINLLTA